jgi:outer membrane protein assembly factor BamB
MDAAAESRLSSIAARMRPYRTLTAPPYGSRRHSTGRLILLVLIIAGALTAALIALVWYIRIWSVGAAVGRALVLLQSAQTGPQVDEAFAAWEAETHGRWRGREADVIDHVFANLDPTDAPVRALLACVSGADYGTRRADWDRWHADWKRRRDGKPPAVKSDEAVRLERAWEAPIGLTAWYTTILPIDGSIFVAGLGADTSGVDDPSDGLVRVDGITGAAALVFVPPDRGPRDILGLAAGADTLFLACRNGSVYSVAPTGELRWKTFVGGPIVSIPLAAEINADSVTDVAVVVQPDKVVALNGANGRTLWAAAAPPNTPRSDVRAAPVTASLARGDLFPTGGDELLVSTTAGHVRVLALNDGAMRWKGAVEPGCYGGALLPHPETSPGRPALIVDGGGGIWSLLHAGRGLDAVLTRQLGARSVTAVVAAPRSLLSGATTDDAPVNAAAPWLVTCSAGAADGPGGSVFALAGEAVRWRYTPGGVIWGTPAVADLNADRRSEVVVATLERAAADGASPELMRGGLYVLSQDGHLLRHAPLPAPVECSPVVSDVNGDGRLDVLVADRSGVLHCFSTRGYGPVEWGVYGGDARNARDARRAYAWGQAPHGHQWRWRP